jgi:hypothetical protein
MGFTGHQRYKALLFRIIRIRSFARLDCGELDSTFAEEAGEYLGRRECHLDAVFDSRRS